MTKSEIKKLDTMWREAIKKRDGSCMICGSHNYLNAHHVVGRRNRNLRWNLDNGILLCSGCHTFKTESAHQDPLKFMEWFKETYPDRYKHIKSNGYTNKKITYEEALELVKKV